MSIEITINKDNTTISTHHSPTIESNQTFIHNQGVERYNDGFSTSSYENRRRSLSDADISYSAAAADGRRQRTESGTKRTNNLVTKRPPRPAQTNEEVYHARRVWYHTHRERVALPGGLVVVVEGGEGDDDVNGGGGGQQQRPLPMLFLLIFCTVFGMCTWFSAGAVLPQLKDLYGIDEMMGASLFCLFFFLFASSCSLLLLFLFV